MGYSADSLYFPDRQSPDISSFKQDVFSMSLQMLHFKKNAVPVIFPFRCQMNQCFQHCNWHRKPFLVRIQGIPLLLSQGLSIHPVQDPDLLPAAANPMEECGQKQLDWALSITPELRSSQGPILLNAQSPMADCQPT